MGFALLSEVEPAVAASDGRPEAGPVYRASYSKDFPSLPGASTCQELFETSCKLYADCPCLGHREALPDGTFGAFKFITYREAEELVIAAASGYARLGIKPKDRIGVLSANCTEWMIAMQAMNRMSAVCVPLYETLGDNAIQYICQHSEARLVLAAAAKLKALAAAMASAKDVVDCGVVYWGGEPDKDALAKLQGLGVKVMAWTELLAEGRKAEAFPVRPSPEDLCTIMYTSGTTGDPKGVLISHKAVVSTVAGVKAFLDNCKEAMGPTDSYLSYLPLAHIFDRVVEEQMLQVGGCVGYWSGDVKRLIEDVDALKPTLFAGVPRVFERIYNGVQDKLRAGSFLKSIIFNWAFNRKEYYMKAGWRHDVASKVSDMLVFNTIKQRLGGRVRVIVSGGAPLSNEIERFLRVAMCAPVVQGYGLTETCAASFIASPDAAHHLGTVGAPMPVTEMRLEAVPELNYSPSSQPPRGEVCIRGPGLFCGYYKNDTMTKEVIDADGFFHTGDIGEIVEDGTLRIIDRKKNIFKLSHGEYIAVEKVENVYKTCPLVEQVWVYGDSTEACLVALVVPQVKPLMAWAADNGVQGDIKALCSNVSARKFVLDALVATGKASKLNSLELVKAVWLADEHFSVDNDLLTPTFKLKRAPLLKRYAAEVKTMYGEIAKEFAQAAKAKGGAGPAQDAKPRPSPQPA